MSFNQTRNPKSSLKTSCQGRHFFDIVETPIAVPQSFIPTIDFSFAKASSRCREIPPQTSRSAAQMSPTFHMSRSAQRISPPSPSSHRTHSHTHRAAYVELGFRCNVGRPPPLPSRIVPESVVPTSGKILHWGQRN